MVDDEDDSITVSVEGISVSKRIETERFPTLAIVLDITSERDDSATVLITEVIPSDINADDVGFHPNFGEAYWSMVDEDTIVFEREFDPDSTYTTIYGFRDFPEENRDALMGEPQVEINPADSETVKSGTESPEADEEIAAGVQGDVDRAVVQDSDTGSIVRTIAKELDRGIAGPEEREMLREQLRPSEDSHDPKIKGLQQQISDFEAYIDALEDFLETEGTADQVYDRFQDEIDALDGELEELSEEFEPILDEVDTLDDQLDSLEDELTTADSRLDQIADGLDDVDTEVGALDSRIDNQENQIEDMSDELDEFDERVDDIDDELSEIESGIENLRGEIREDIRALEDDIEDFEELRERLASVFGSGMGMGGSEVIEAESEDSNANGSDSTVGDRSEEPAMDDSTASGSESEAGANDSDDDDDEMAEE